MAAGARASATKDTIKRLGRERRAEKWSATSERGGDRRRQELDEACAVTPGIESPTVSPLHREGWVAVRAMVPRADAQRVMDALWEIGARAIFVTDILACRL